MAARQPESTRIRDALACNSFMQPGLRLHDTVDGRELCVLAIDLPPKLQAELERVAAQTGRTPAECAREAVIQFLEDLYDVRLAEERLQTLGKCWTLEEVEQGLDLNR